LRLSILKLIETYFKLLKKSIGRVYPVKATATKDYKYAYECSTKGTDFVDREVCKKIETL